MDRRNFLGTLSLTPVAFKELLGINSSSFAFLGKFYLPWKTVYKVVTDDYRSLQYYSLPNTVGLDYQFGEWISPKIGKIFTFSSLNDAINLIRKYFHKARILESKTQNYEIGNYAFLPGGIQEINSFWNNLEFQQAHIQYTMNKYYKTVYCDSIKCEREIVI